MRSFELPPFATEVSRRCPRCGRGAVVHGRIVRAIHDWETTFVECLRLRCCGATFLAAPWGLTPRARYSDRVRGLARALYQLGLSHRDSAHVLRRARVPTTVQAVRRWCAKAVRRGALIPALAVELGGAAGGDLAFRLRPGAWMLVHCDEPTAALRVFERELGELRPAAWGSA